MIAVAIALLIQALFFGDGGVLAFGANAFNMAFVMPFAGYGVYRLLAGRTRSPSRRRALAAGIGGYVGINVAALWRRSSSACSRRSSTPPTARRCTRRSSSPQTIPAMMLAHLTIAGVVEAR